MHFKITSATDGFAFSSSTEFSFSRYISGLHTFELDYLVPERESCPPPRTVWPVR